METSNKKTIVLIHGLFLNEQSWNDWKIYFEQKGYNVLTSTLPGHKGAPSDLRKKTHAQLQNTGFEDAYRSIEAFIDSLPEKPIVIGHSLGGLIVQKLIDQEKVAAGISLDGAPPKNIMAPLSTLSTIWPIINIFKGNS